MRAPTHSRAAVVAKSVANWAASASTKTYQAREGANAETTSAGPTEYQLSVSATSARSGCARRVATGRTSPSSSPRATSTGTASGGTRKSIGTKASWVGPVKPVPSWRRISAITAYVSTRPTTVQALGHGSSDAISNSTATTTDRRAATRSTRRSRGSKRRATSGSRRSSSRSAVSIAARAQPRPPRCMHGHPTCIDSRVMPRVSDRLRIPPGPVDLRAIDARATPGFKGGKADAAAGHDVHAERLSTLQEQLYAEGRLGGTRSLLLVLQGMDTSGKGGTVRHVVGQVDPSGVHVHAFGPPTAEEHRHEFLWR